MTQCGKTFRSIESMKDRLKKDPTSIHLVYTMNTLLNNHQFAKRLEPIEHEYGFGSVLVFTSTYKGTYQHAKNKKHFDKRVATRLPRVILMCSNTTRFTEGHEWVHEMSQTHPKINIHLYYDELHQYINKSMRNQLEGLHALANVASILALTATPNSIIQKRGPWSTLRLIASDQVKLDDYAKLEDMMVFPDSDYFKGPYHKPMFNDFDRMDEETIGFMEHVLAAHPEMLEPGARCFVPAHIRRSGHTKVRDLIWAKCDSAVIVTINGVDKVVQFYKTKEDASYESSITSVSLLSDGGIEVSDRIAQILVEHELMDRPLFMTGFMCVSVGQTLTSKEVGNFTHAILSHMNLNNEMTYQLFGRLTGRVKAWEKYQPTKLYCPTPVMNRIKVMERCASDSMKKIKLNKKEYENPMDTMPEGADVRENQRKKIIEEYDENDL